MREIVLDTETTGMEPSEGHKLVEIGCVELINHVPSGKTYHVYLNPEREVPAEAAAVHGLTYERLKTEPTFGEIVTDFLDFIADSNLVIHNAEFDMKFINSELKAFGFPSIDSRRVTDTLKIARMKFPGSPANLDALCRRFNIDNSNRTLHGALLDSELLAEVYMELLGGRQHGLGLQVEKESAKVLNNLKDKPYREPRDFSPSAEEIEAHENFITKLKDPLWKSQ